MTASATKTAGTGTKITVYHYLENANDNNYTLTDTVETTGTTGATITLANYKKNPMYTNYTYSKGSLTAGGASATTTTVAADGSTKLYLYYTRNKYTLTVSAGSNISSVSGGGTYKFGQSVTIDATLATATGYTITFEKWTSSNTGLLANNTTKNATITMPAGNVTMTASATKTVGSDI